VATSSIDRRCPKCGGKILIDKDYHGWYEQCLQCAYIRDLKVLYQHKNAAAAPEKRRETAGVA
jgi:DNA-directed RNA polymerase subunit M/transcription elongation factor TFIIS